MNEFDLKAAGWDSNDMHHARSAAIVEELLRNVHVSKNMSALEFGAGTGLTSFLLKDQIAEIVMMDSSPEMVRVMKEKVKASGALNLKPVLFDLEKKDWKGGKFNLLLTQMVLHHVINLDKLLSRFFDLVLPGGYLAIADLYTEDGSFHGKNFTGHKGFDTDLLADKLRQIGFANVSARKCFTINKITSDSETRNFDVFLMVAYRP